MEGFLRFMRNGGGKSFQTMLPPAVFVAGMTLRADDALLGCIWHAQVQILALGRQLGPGVVQPQRIQAWSI